MEASRGAKLRRNLEALQCDLAAALCVRDQMGEVAQAAQQFVAEQHRRLEQVGEPQGGRRSR